jgi:hypothetical protein
MQIADAQLDVRCTYLNGSVGQLVSGAIWLGSAAAATWSGVRPGIWILALGGAFIFPLTVLVLKLSGGPGVLPRKHPMNALAMQIAFTVPLAAPVAAAATIHHLNWFYPAVAIVVGAHYLPFTFLYGMWQYAVLGALMLAGGLVIAMQWPDSFASGGWFGGGLLWLFALWVFPRTRRPGGSMQSTN